MLDVSDVTDHVTGLLMLVAIMGVVYMWRHRSLPDGQYKLLGWSALFTVTGTVWAGRMLHAYVEPRSLITPLMLVGWTFCSILVLTLFIITVRRHRRKNGLD